MPSPEYVAWRERQFAAPSWWKSKGAPRDERSVRPDYNPSTDPSTTHAEHELQMVAKGLVKPEVFDYWRPVVSVHKDVDVSQPLRLVHVHANAYELVACDD